MLIQIQQLSGAAVESVHVHLQSLLDGNHIPPLHLHGLHLPTYQYLQYLNLNLSPIVLDLLLVMDRPVIGTRDRDEEFW